VIGNSISGTFSLTAAGCASIGIESASSAAMLLIR
jgi:hypothetical protein